MSVENKQVRGDASVSRNVNAGGNARVQGSMHVGHNLRVDGAIEAQNIKAANKGLFLDEAQLKARYPQPEEGWFAGVGSSSPFVVYIARKDADGRVDWYATNGTFSVDVDMDSYNQRIDDLESQVAELIEIILSGGGGNVVNVRVSVEGHGSVTGSGLYQIGNPVTLTATAENGYHFVEWQDAEGNTIAGAGATYTFDATESVTLKAVFAVSYYTVTAAPNDSALGSVSVSPAVPAGQSGYTYGTQITLTATVSTTTAQRPYYFVGWSDGVTDSQRTILMNRNIELQANFAQEQEAIANVATAGSGNVEITVTRGETTVQATNVRIGDDITLTATGITNKPSALVDGGGTAIACEFSQDGKVMTYSFRYDGTQSLTFTATFGGEVIEVKRTISVTAKSNWGTAKIMVGEADKGPSTQVVAGTQVTLIASANSGFTFDHWQLNGSPVSTTSTFYVTMPDSDVSYLAVFRHSEAPDYYYGVVNTPTGSSHAADAVDLEEHITGGYLADSTKAYMQIPKGNTFVILYDETRVLPASYKLTTDFGNDTGTDFDNVRKFYTGTRVVNNISYTTIELVGGSESDNPMPVEITFTANSNS